MSNIKQKIDGHNKSMLSEDTTNTQATPKQCNCRKTNECPLAGLCQTKSVIYQATVRSNDGEPEQSYIGLTENTFKTRYGNHKSSFKHQSKQHSTELSKYIWQLKNKNTQYHISWKILRQARAYNNATKRCNLCNWEKYYIMCKPAMSTLNKRNELVTTCRHSRKFLLMNFN